MEHVDTLVHARWVVPVTPRHRELEHHSVAIRDGQIIAVLPQERARKRFTAAHEEALTEHVLIPGLVNAHTHSAMSLFRGMADDKSLMVWLHDHIWPAEARVVSETFVRDGARLAVAEMLLSGTTCFNDMYFFPDQVGKVCVDAGIRAVLGLIVVDFPTVWANDADDYIAKGIALHDECKYQPLLTTAFAPHAPYTVSDQPLQRIQMLAHELDLPIHIHLNETADEVRDAIAKTGNKPLNRLLDMGLLTPRLLAVHMTQLDDEDINLFAAHNAHVVHCPESNLKLASGFCPVTKLMEAGINVALGTDSAASNNDLDMFGEMRTAAQLAKAVAGDAAALPAADALRMATINGARALGLSDQIGSLEPGKSADMVAVDLSDLATQPVYSATSSLVYAANRRQVSHVWVNGTAVVEEGLLRTLDTKSIAAKAAEWQHTISNPADAVST